jgi:hypothetical protein
LNEESEQGPGRTARVVLLLVLAVILAVTLMPMRNVPTQPLSDCIICGSRGLADAILNTAMFAPLGFLLAGRWRAAVALAAAAALTLSVELAQTVIPGRDPSAGDVVFNTLGAALGILAWRLRGRWVAPRPGTALALALAAAALVAAIMFLTGWLLRPAPPPPPYTVVWQPSQPHFSWYNGRVLNGGIGQMRLRPGPTPQSAAAAVLLARGAPLGVWTVWGGQSAGLAPLIILYDTEAREAALLGVDRSDVVFRQRTRASQFRLTNPAVRLPGVLDSLAVGDSVRIASGAAPTPYARCFDVASHRYCGVGYTAAGGWALLLAPGSMSQAALSRMDALWLALIALPAGYWATPRLALLIFTALSWYGMFRVPIDTVARPVPIVALIGLALGLVAGLALGAYVRRWPGRRAVEPEVAESPT